MEKLLELLNEYCPGPYSYSDGHFWFTLGKRTLDAEPIIISKKHGFIKWLVENEKLKWTDKMEKRKLMLGMPEKQDYYIMMLAVTPQPIEFLISILK